MKVRTSFLSVLVLLLVVVLALLSPACVSPEPVTEAPGTKRPPTEAVVTEPVVTETVPTKEPAEKVYLVGQSSGEVRDELERYLMDQCGVTYDLIESAEYWPKMEAWLVRHGSAYFYAEGEPTPGVDERIPPLHKQCAKARTEVFKEPGGVVVQPVPEARHWVKAGPKGAIITEVATYHSMDALKFTHPDIKL